MTTLKPLTRPAALLSVGGAWALVVETRDASGNLSSEVVPNILVTLPDASTVSPVPTAKTTGLWSVIYTVSLSGRYIANVSTPEDALGFAAYAAGPTASSGMPDVNAVARYLREGAASWSQADMQDALDSEASAQRAACTIGAVYPPDLRNALLRRVQRNLAMRPLSLAIASGDAEMGPVNVPRKDPEVRRLEAPYLKLSTG